MWYTYTYVYIHICIFVSISIYTCVCMCAVWLFHVCTYDALCAHLVVSQLDCLSHIKSFSVIYVMYMRSIYIYMCVCACYMTLSRVHIWFTTGSHAAVSRLESHTCEFESGLSPLRSRTLSDVRIWLSHVICHVSTLRHAAVPWHRMCVFPHLQGALLQGSLADTQASLGNIQSWALLQTHRPLVAIYNNVQDFERKRVQVLLYMLND